MTMIELLVGLAIFSFAMIPILNFGTTTTRTTFITGKHMLAGQIAASVLDRILALPYEESWNYVQALKAKDKIPVVEDPDLLELLGHQALSENLDVLKGDLQKSFRFFEFSVAATPDPVNPPPGKMFLVTVLVSWRVDEGTEGSRTPILLEGVKFSQSQ